MLTDMLFDGLVLSWGGRRFKATSGLPGWQMPQNQCLPDQGPIPEGFYRFSIKDAGSARDDGTQQCRLTPAAGIQTIPRGEAAGLCEPYWANWGRNRVRLEAADVKTRQACKPARSGFYLHDSTKGYSHGCIEVEPAFFQALHGHVVTTGKQSLALRVQYVADRATNGGTRVY